VSELSRSLERWLVSGLGGAHNLSDLDAERSQCQGTMGMTTGLYYLDAERLDTYEYVGIAKGIGNTYSQCQGTMGMTTERRNDRMRYK
jgi:hypothetical protein